MKPKITIAPKHKRILEYIHDFKKRNRGTSPSLSQLKYKFDITNGTIQDHLKNMTNEGLITKIPGAHRSLALTDKGEDALS